MKLQDLVGRQLTSVIGKKILQIQNEETSEFSLAPGKTQESGVSRGWGWERGLRQPPEGKQAWCSPAPEEAAAQGFGETWCMQMCHSFSQKGDFSLPQLSREHI